MALVDVTKEQTITVPILDTVARAALGGACTGVTKTKSLITIHVDDAGQNVQKANAILDNWNSLLVATTQMTIDADGVDTAVITHETPDGQMNYYVWLGDTEYSFGTVDAVASVVTLNLATDTPGVYTVLLARQSGNYATGIQIVTAEE